MVPKAPWGACTESHTLGSLWSWLPRPGPAPPGHPLRTSPHPERGRLCAVGGMCPVRFTPEAAAWVPRPRLVLPEPSSVTLLLTGGDGWQGYHRRLPRGSFLCPPALPPSFPHLWQPGCILPVCSWAVPLVCLSLCGVCGSRPSPWPVLVPGNMCLWNKLENRPLPGPSWVSRGLQGPWAFSERPCV